MKISKFSSFLLGILSSALLAGPVLAEDVRIGGTGMTLGLVQALKGPFERYSPGDQLVVVPGLGSGAGIAALADKALDVSVAGRQLKDEEKAKGLKSRPFIETPFILVSNTKSALELSSEKLVKIYSGGKIYLSDGLRARIILRTEWDSASRFLVDNIEGMEEALKNARSVAGIPIAQTDQENMELAQKISGAVTTMTMAQIKTEPNTLQIIKIDGADPQKAIEGTGDYPFYKNTWMMTHETITPSVQRFLDFLATDEAASVYKSAGAKRVE